jgi:hypothetical protein
MGQKLQPYGAKTSALRGQTSALWVNPPQKKKSCGLTHKPEVAPSVIQ